MNLARDLAEAGFTGVSVTSQPGWHATERALWESVLRAEPDGDPALSAFREEAAGILPLHENRRRVLATATR